MKKNLILVACFIYIGLASMAQKPKTPIMGWSSWNNFRVDISEQLIRQQADAMLSTGMYAAGYRFVNIDDGYFGGRDAGGNLFANAQKFPSGMKALADYIHSKGLKAGIYSDAGANTCGSIWDHDSLGVGAGMHGHVKQDADLFFRQWGYDFLKVDWCGGEKLKLDEKTAYLDIIQTVKGIDTNIVFNICRWQFPGEWAINAADSWRVSGDISASWESVCKIIDINADLGKYVSPGHFNDMDMLQVGRGMTYEEDKAHFSMWCMLASPLLAGNDLRHMSQETVGILTNSEVIALDQDPLCVPATRVLRTDSVELWVRPLKAEHGSAKAVAILNRGNAPAPFVLKPADAGVPAGAKVRDLWLHQDQGSLKTEGMDVKLPAHSVLVLKVD